MYQTINLGSAANDGTGDNLRTGGAKLNAMFRETYGYGARHMPVEIFTEGDSLAPLMGQMTARSALFWAIALHQPDIVYYGNLGVGASFSGAYPSDPTRGMTSPQRLQAAATAYAGSRARGRSPVAIMSIGTNDAVSSNDNAADSTVANVQKYWREMSAAGLDMLIINAPGPTYNQDGSASPSVILGMTKALRAWADTQRGRVAVIDNTWIQASDGSTFRPPAASNTYGGIHYDTGPGLHPSGNGARMMGQYGLGPLLRRVFGPRAPLLGPRSDSFVSPGNVRGSVLGAMTRFGTTGSTSGAHAVTGGGGLVGIDQFPANGQKLTGTLSGDQTVTCAQVDDPFAALIGRTDIKATRLRFAGTPTSAGSLTIGSLATLPSGFDPSTTPFFCEAQVQVDLTNVRGPELSWSGGGIGARNTSDADIHPRITGMMTIGNSAPYLLGANYGNITASMTVDWIAGKAVAGDLIISGMGIFPAPALPAATA